MKSRKLLYPYIVWMAIFVIVPLAMIVYYAFTDKNGAFTFDNLQFIAKNASTYVDSLKIALISTAVCLILAYPLALIMSRMKVRTQKMMNMLIMLPMWMNFVLRICAWMLILKPDGVLDSLLGVLGFGNNHIYQTETAIVIGIVYNYLPFMVLPIYTTMAKISRSLIEAGQDLGCNGFNVLRRIILPLSVPGVITGITMVFVPAASTFYISTYLGGRFLIGDTIQSYYKGIGANNHIGSMLALGLMVIILISMAIMNKFDSGEDSAIV